MDRASWDNKTKKIRLWLENYDAGAIGKVIRINLDSGDKAKSEKERERYWLAVRSLTKANANNPFQRKKGRVEKMEKNSSSKKAKNETKFDTSKLVNSKLVADLYRHRFTNLVKAKNDDTWWPSSGSISRVLKPMSLAEASNNDGEGEEHDAAHYMMSKTLFEANYVDGLEDGEYKEWHLNGKKAIRNLSL